MKIFFGNRNDPNRDERENIKRVYLLTPAHFRRVCAYNIMCIFIFFYARRITRRNYDIFIVIVINSNNERSDTQNYTLITILLYRIALKFARLISLYSGRRKVPIIGCNYKKGFVRCAPIHVDLPLTI